MNTKYTELLSETTIDPKYYDKVITYINTHILLENMGATEFENYKSNSTLSVALNVISKLKNLDKVTFLTSPMLEHGNHSYQVETLVVTTPIPNITSGDVSIDKIIELENINIEQISEYFNELLDDNELYIYVLYNELQILLNNEDNTINLHTRHRFLKI